MSNYLQFALLGLGAGALYAALAQGLILAHRGAGVINFAHGAMAMYAAYCYYGIREQGRLPVPPLPNPLALVEGVAGWFGAGIDLPDLPTFIDLGGEVAMLPSFLLALAMACLLGGAMHILVFRPLRDAPPLAKTVASVGVALVLQAIVSLRFGTDSIAMDPVLPQDTVRPAGTAVPVDRFILLGVAVVIAAGLMALFRYTRIGISTRAAADNERAAVLIGLSPDRLAGFNWVLSSVIAGAAGILFASITGLNPTDFVLYVIPALGAALLARLESFTIAAAAGLLIGVLQSLVLPAQGDLSWFPDVGAASGIPLVVIVIAMVARGDRLPRRGSATEMRLPRFPNPVRPLRTAAIVCPLVVLGLLFLPFDLRSALINSLAGVVLALSFVVVVGMAGQISLMQMAIAGMAGIAMTRLAGDWGIPFPFSPILAVIVAAVAGVVAGLPAMRVRGVHLAVLTLGGAYAFEQMVVANGDVVRTTDASGSVPPPSLFGFQFGVNSDFPFGASGTPSPWFGLFELLVAVVCCWFVIRLRRSEVGLRLLGIRANEKAASALGVDVARTKILAFGIGALFAGLAGVLSAYRFQGLTPDEYVAMTSVTALALAYIGGITMIWGAAWAGALATGGFAFVLTDRLFHLGQFEPLMAGVGLVLTAVLNPEGIAGAMQSTSATIRRLVRRHREADVEHEPESATPAPAELALD